MIMFGSFLPSLGWLAPPKFTRVWEPTLLWNHFTSNPEIAGVIAPALFTTIIVSPSQSPFLVSLQAGFIARWYEHVPIDPATCNRCAERTPERGTRRTPNRCPPDRRNTGACGRDARSVAWVLGFRWPSLVATRPQRHPLRKQDD